MSQFTSEVIRICKHIGIDRKNAMEPVAINGNDLDTDAVEIQIGIRVKDIVNAVGEYASDRANCYPGYPGSACYDRAFFISIQNPEIRRGRGHLKFSEMLEKLIEHFLICPNTREVILIADSWDPKALNKWDKSIRKIQQNVDVEFYIIGKGTPVFVPF